MPGTWPDDDGFGDDDADDTPLAAPVHPDDRLWRHPSEMAWGVPPPSAAAPAVPPRPPARTWVVAVASGLTGAALTLGLLVLFTGLTPAGPGPDRTVDRAGARAELPSSPAAAATAGVVTVAQSVLPSIVRLDVTTTRGALATGSGVVVLDDGHILTAAHVVDEARTITIVQSDGTTVAGRLVGADPVTDLAVVAPVDHADVDWVPAERGPASELDVGEPALVIGAPSVTLGVVSGLGRRVGLTDGGTLHGMVQTDAPIAAGASGGALCDREGRVVGITTAAVAGPPTGGFATPMEAAWPVAEALIEDGVARHGWLGIEGGDLDVTRVSILGIAGSVRGGVVVDRVVAGSPAEAAGLRAGDVLTRLDGAPLASMSDLVVALRAREPGDRVTLEVERGGRTGRATVELTERPG